jgi:hypothetical protein
VDPQPRSSEAEVQIMGNRVRSKFTYFKVTSILNGEIWLPTSNAPSRATIDEGLDHDEMMSNQSSMTDGSILLIRSAYPNLKLGPPRKTRS